MIRVTIELLPGGDAKRATTLGIIDVANVTPDALEVDGLADYEVCALDVQMELMTTSMMRGFVRKRGFWALIREALALPQPAAHDRKAT